jgi:hypothetical protein
MTSCLTDVASEPLVQTSMVVKPISARSRPALDAHLPLSIRLRSSPFLSSLPFLTRTSRGYG